MKRCTQCDEQFSRQSSLNRHIATKHAQGQAADRYQCAECSKAFARRDILDRHVRLHSGDDGIPCLICQRCFRRDYLQKHQQRCARKASALRPLSPANNSHGAHDIHNKRSTAHKSQAVAWIDVTKSFPATATSMGSAHTSVSSTRRIRKPAKIMSTEPSAARIAKANLVREAIRAIEKGDLPTLGILLHSPEINEISMKTFDCMFTLMASDSEDGTSMMHLAAEHGHLQIVGYLSAGGWNVDNQDNHGLTALHLASMSGHLSVVQFLVSRNARIDLVDDEGETSLLKAARWGYLAIISLLLDHGAHIDGGNRTSNDSTPLVHALEKGHYDAALILVDRGASIDVKGPGGSTPLHYAARAGKSSLMCSLVAKGADRHASDGNSETPIQAAANGGQPEALRALLDPKDHRLRSELIDLVLGPGELSNVEALRVIFEGVIDGDATVPIDAVVPTDVRSITRTQTIFGDLIDANPEDPPTAGTGVAQLAVLLTFGGHRASLRKLIFRAQQIGISMHDVDAEVYSRSGRSLLVWAIISQELDLFRDLAMLGCDVDAPGTEYGGTALHEACNIRGPAFVKVLLSHGASTDARTPLGTTPLAVAARRGFEDGVRMLLEHGAGPDGSDHSPVSSPLELARAFSHRSVMRMLLDAGASLNAETPWCHDKALVHRSATAGESLLPAGAIVDELNEGVGCIVM